MMLFAAILGLAWPISITAEHPPSSYSTLVVEYVGEQDRPIGAAVISASREEGEWYKENLYKEGSWNLAEVFVVPRSTLVRITELPLLKRELQRATRNEEMPHRPLNVRFVVGVGHDHKEIMLDAPTSAEILRDIAKRVSKYPGLESQIQEVLYAITSSRK
jgi:hypothetical protein